MRFQSLQLLSEFCTYIEHQTELYKLDFLGYPWYKMCKDYFNNFISEIRPTEFSEEHKRIRAEDFNKKWDLLNRKYDYVFFEKAKMRRKDIDNCENGLFLDIYHYLDKRGKSFIIFEEPSGKEFDLKYLNSQYAHKTVPYEILSQSLRIALSASLENSRRYFLGCVETLFANCMPEPNWTDYARLLKERYLSLASEIPDIFIRQTLLNQLEVKALFGGMGTHFSAGLNNLFAVIEVGHGFPGKLGGNLTSSTLLKEYERDHFRLGKFYGLLPSPTEELSIENQYCLTENSFNYGMPELRAYLRKGSDLNKLNQKLNLDGQFTILVATTGWVDYQALERLLITVRRTFPSSNILFRPHPSYDNVSRIASKEINYILVEKENKYDLFSVADAVLSPPSSMITEASRFTDNIIVYPNRNDTGSKGREILQRWYPNLKVIPLEDISRLLTQLEYFRNHPQKKHPQTDAFDYEKELDRLFYRIENDDIVGVRN